MPRPKKSTHARPVITNIRQAGPDNQVIDFTTRRDETPPCVQARPCPQCPWRKDAVGVFPPEAFRHSAETAYDMAKTTFACHTSGKAHPSTCAGFLLSSGADHNMNVRLWMIDGVYRPWQVSSGGHELFGSYREMATANGVDPRDPVLEQCL